MNHVFISYSRKDLTVMKRVRNDLRAANIPLWTDETLKPGTPSWRNAIEAAIEDAGALVILMSPDSKKSEWVEREISYATACNVPIFPVLIKGSERNAVPFELSNVQWIDIRDNYSLVSNALVPAIKDILGIQDAPPPVERRATVRTTREPFPPPPVEPKPQPVVRPQTTARVDTSATRAQTMTSSELAQIFGFSLEELALNRRGSVSQRQRKTIASGSFPGLITVLVALVVGAAYCQETTDVFSGPTATLGLIGFGGVALMFITFAYLDNFGKVARHTGRVTIDKTVTGTRLKVASVSLKLSKGKTNMAPTTLPGTYTVYVTGSGPTLLSIEPERKD